ncbi:hypothetical protein B0H14DRAFT_2634818 [Mycena olivaceomarginata]|nr:hypothetical protein B0H14DRAFT_2634818 [Mycena olivaceomarginata]
MDNDVGSGCLGANTYGNRKYFPPPIQSEAVTTNNLIYDSGGLSDGNHTLVVTAQNDQAVWVDYFLITPGPPIVTPTPTPTPSPTLTPTPTALLAKSSAHVGETYQQLHWKASTADALQPVPGSQWMTGPTAVVRQPLLSDANDTPNRPFSASSSHSKFYPVGKHAYNGSTNEQNSARTPSDKWGVNVSRGWRGPAAAVLSENFAIE